MQRILFLLLFFASFQLDALRVCGPHALTIGPEVYYVVRTRAGGARQDGTMYGLSAKYERLRGCSLYWAVQYDGGWGELYGSDANGNDVKSYFSEQQIEGRLGYNYQWKFSCKPYILPFIGYGYHTQTNDFIQPSPLEVQFKDYFPYSAVGIQVGINLTSRMTLGLLFKADWMLEGNSKIEGIEEFGTVKLNMEEEWQYTFEAPLTYRSQLRCRTFYFMFTPFVRFRHFGGLPGFPLDFLDTHYRNYGAKLLCGYDF